MGSAPQSQSLLLLTALRRSALLGRVSAQVSAELVDRAEVEQLSAGAAPARNDAMYVVTRGRLHLVAPDGSVLREFGPWSLVGDDRLFSPIPGLPPAELVAGVHTEVVGFYPEHVRSLPPHARHEVQRGWVRAFGLSGPSRPASVGVPPAAADAGPELGPVDERHEPVVVVVGSADGVVGGEDVARLSWLLGRQIEREFAEDTRVFVQEGDRWRVRTARPAERRLRSAAEVRAEAADSGVLYVLLALDHVEGDFRNDPTLAAFDPHLYIDLRRPSSERPDTGIDRSHILRTVVLDGGSSDAPPGALRFMTYRAERQRECRLPRSLLRGGTAGGLEYLAPHDQEALARWARFVTGRTVGVALGGGGAWAYQNVALLQELRAHDIPIDLTSGTSFGALVSVYHAAKGAEGLAQLVERGKSFDWVQWFSILTTAVLEELIARDLDDVRLEHLPITSSPFATNLTQGTGQVAYAGPAARAARASSSAPGIYGPTVLKGRGVFVDGAIARNVPAGVLIAQGADLIVASNVIPSPRRRPVPRSRFRRWLREFNPISRLQDAEASLLLMMREQGGLSDLRVLEVGGVEALLERDIDPGEFAKASQIVEACRRDEEFQQDVSRIVDAFQERKQRRA